MGLYWGCVIIIFLTNIVVRDQKGLESTDLEYATSKAQENEEGVQMNGAH
jgi:hypothetical protein